MERQSQPQPQQQMPQPRRRVSGVAGAQRAAEDRTRLIYGTPARGGAEGGAGQLAQAQAQAEAQAEWHAQPQPPQLPQPLQPQRRRAATESSRHGLLGGWL
jgi:mediator of RNA polymerase II transcription subunit 15